MMDLTSGQYIQLIAALVLVIIAFVGAYAGPERPIVTILILLLPFQPVTSKFGSVNTGLALLVFAAFLLKGRLRRFPLLFLVGAVMLAYMLSFTQVARETYPDHVYYLVAICANFALFYIVYNHVSHTGDIHRFFNTLLWMNILVDIYCFAQLLIGVDTGVHLGAGDLALRENRWDDRLAGPFAAVGVTAEYLVIQILLEFHMYQHEAGRNRRLLLAGVVMANLAFLVATGNRGGFIVLIGGSVLYLVWYRRELGFNRVLASAALGVFALAVVSVVIVTFTDFNVLYDRLLGTEVKEGVPDSRLLIWPEAWERIKEKPVLGHGPRFRLISEESGLVPWYQIVPYPHNLYLFLLTTIGVVGMAAWFVFFYALFRRFRRARNNPHPDPFIAGLPKLSILILVVLLVDQIKVSMFRFNLSDYQQIVFVLIGGLLATAWIAMHPDRSKST